MESWRSDGPEFASAAVLGEVERQQTEALADLRAMEAAIDDTSDHASALDLLVGRYEVLFTQFLWQQASLQSRAFQDRVDVLVATSDKPRKMMAHGSPWLRERSRSLAVLTMDEVENKEFLDVVAAAASVCATTTVQCRCCL